MLFFLTQQILQMLHILNNNYSTPKFKEKSKKAINDLGFEYWVDIFACVPRAELAQKVPEIGDFGFAHFAQSFLHEFGQISLGQLEIRIDFDADDPKDNLVESFLATWWAALPTTHIAQIVQIPLAVNVKGFEVLTLSYIDHNVLALLYKFQRHSLLSNVCLRIEEPDKFTQLRQRQLLPFLQSLNALHIDGRQGVFPLMEEAERVNNPPDGSEAANPEEHAKLKNYRKHIASLLSTVKFLHTRVCMTGQEFGLFTRWLYQRRADGEPRMVEFRFAPYWRQPFLDQFILLINQDFHKATESANFLIAFKFPSSEYLAAIGMETTTISENNLTGEFLTIGGHDKSLVISRFPKNACQEWVQAKTTELLEWEFDRMQRRIEFSGIFNLRENEWNY